MSHKMKDVASGKAALWQGYKALLGFGITRIKNQARAAKPSKGMVNLIQNFRQKTIFE